MEVDFVCIRRLVDFGEVMYLLTIILSSCLSNCALVVFNDFFSLRSRLCLGSFWHGLQLTTRSTAHFSETSLNLPCNSYPYRNFL